MGISPKGHRGIAEESPRGRREGFLTGLKLLAQDNPSRADASVRERDEGREDGGHGMPGQWTKGRDGVGGRGETATHTGRDGAGEEKKKKKPPKKKAPNKKRETAACGSACLRAAAPPSSLASLPLLPLPMAAAPPHTPSSRLSLASPSPSSYGGCAATLPAPFSYPLRASLASCGRIAAPPLRLSSRTSFGRLRRPLSPLPFSRQRFAPPPPCPPISLRLKTHPKRRHKS